MQNERPQANFDPYKPLDQSLDSGDRLNAWILKRPRQKIVQLLRGQRVLDVCCGTGTLTAMLVAAECQVVGVDRSPTMLAHARRKRIAAEFKQLDATQLPFEREFDAAVISLAIHEMSPQVREKAWEAMRRAVRLSGRLIALDYARPVRHGLSARIAGWLIEQDERSLLNVHAEHYHNFREFMQHGGLLPWVQAQGQPVEADYRYWGGTVAVIVICNTG